MPSRGGGQRAVLCRFIWSISKKLFKITKTYIRIWRVRKLSEKLAAKLHFTRKKAANISAVFVRVKNIRSLK